MAACAYNKQILIKANCLSFGLWVRKFLPCGSVAGYFRAIAMGHKWKAVAKGQEAGERTGVRGSAQKGSNLLVAKSIKSYLHQYRLINCLFK